MKTTDHFILGKRLCEKFFEEETSLKRLLFVYGNILPDLFPHTYLRKCFSGERLRGHNYLNTREKMKKCMDKMFRLKKMSLWDFLSLGLLMHYVADAFTYAHNKWFKGTLEDHVEYEEQLHKLFAADYKFLSLDFKARDNGGEKLFDFYDRLHDSYQAEIMEIRTDFKYINFMTEFAVEKIVAGCQKKARNIFEYSRRIILDDDGLLAG